MAKNQEKQARIVAIRFKSALKLNVTMWQIVSIMPFAPNLKFSDAHTAVVAALDAFNIGMNRSLLYSVVLRDIRMMPSIALWWTQPTP
jgi:hypothetical protein